MANNDSGKCAHGVCDCAPEPNSKYCSEYCEEAEKSKVMEIGCGCEHLPAVSISDIFVRAVFGFSHRGLAASACCNLTTKL